VAKLAQSAIDAQRRLILVVEHDETGKYLNITHEDRARLDTSVPPMLPADAIPF
jgi:hypothetical protein